MSMKLILFPFLAASLVSLAIGCQFYPAGEYLRFVRVPENLTVGGEVLRIEVHPRKHLSIRPIDKSSDIQYFTYKDVDQNYVSLLLARSLENLVDRDNPQNVLKFRLVCEYQDGDDTISSYLSITVYVEDINDHSPQFISGPYHVSVDELTPVGLTVFRGIQAFDRDKPNTPNSDVQYSLTAGNERGKFALDSSHRALVLLRRALDYDAGDREFNLVITAADRGNPPRSSNTTLRVTVIDNDDLSPKFTKGVYRTKITEFYPLTGERIHKRMAFEPPIFAFDQDLAIDTPIRYDIIAGNERHLFALDPVNGTLFLEREIDLDQERALPGNTFVLQIQASQVDNPVKTGVARVEVEVLDLNDNLPEFEVDFYNISIVENLPNGFSVLQVVATDQDQGDNGEFSYILEDSSGAFKLDSRTGWLTVRDQSVLDREKQSSISMKVFAKEKAPSVITNKEGTAFVSIDVTLLDANDNNPTFIPSNLYELVCSPDAKIGDVIGKVKAVDPDLGRNGVVLYSVQKTTNTSANSPFGVESKTGNIIVREAPLLEGRHAIFVEASDQPTNPSERRFSLAVVTIDVLRSAFRDDESELPNFVGAPYEFWVGTNADIGTSIGQIRVTETMLKKSHIVYDLLHSYHEGVPFAVEERTGTISVVDDLSKFDRPIYDFEAVVSNEKDINLITNVTVHVVDSQDEHGVLTKNTDSLPIVFRVKENQVGAFIGQLMYKNMTDSKFLRFTIANQQDVSEHILITEDGTLYAKQALDREKRDVYRMTVVAEYHRGVVNGAGIYQVVVHVDDENDNAPVFNFETYEGNILENSKAGTEVILDHPILIQDLDFGIHAQFSVTLFGDRSEIFRLDRNTGKVYFNSANGPLDREEKASYSLRVVAKDKGGLRTEAKLTINIEDENDNNPQFTQLVILPEQNIQVEEFDEVSSLLKLVEVRKMNASTYSTVRPRIKNRHSPKNLAPLVSLPENITIGAAVLRLLAEDKDAGVNADISYEMMSETFIPNEVLNDEPFHVTHYFNVHPNSGEITVSRTLPPESEFRLNITAKDGGGLSDNVTIRIHIRDVNDHAPVFKKSWYSFDAMEAMYSRTILGKIEASDVDFGANANISYLVQQQHRDELPFAISEFSGVLSVNGELDREKRDKYKFSVLARDNPASGNSLTSSVEVEVNVLDVNDNAPIFYGYDELLPLSKPEAEVYVNHNFDSSLLIPVYYATAAENSPIGTPVTRVFANDSDFSGNGNGLFLFDIPQRKNKENLFTIDSKEGIVTITGKLDFERQKSHNITIVASDLGSPSLSSYALLVVNVIDVPDEAHAVEKPVFSHRYYEVEVEENVPVPLKLLTLNVTDSYKNHRSKFNLITVPGSEIDLMFKVDPKDGTLFIRRSPDREERDRYELKIRLGRLKMARGMSVMVYPVTADRLTDLGINEVKVIIRITDVNDNVPKFTVTGRPIVAAVPTSAGYGYQIVKLQATDPDLGQNGEIRYQILGRVDDESHKFSIDPVTGNVRSIASFARDAGRVYGFDVKATDRSGADDGKSSIANVFVYVLDESKQLVMVMGSKPTEIEKNMENITTALHNATGFDVRVRKLEPHSERNHVDNSATDVYLYAVDPQLNIIVDMEQLESVLHLKQTEIEQRLAPFNLLNIAMGAKAGSSNNHSYLLSTLEASVIVLGCVIFVSALATVICVTCVKNKRKKSSKAFGRAQTVGYAIATEHLGKPPLFPSTFGESVHYTEPVENYGVMPNAMVHHHHPPSMPKNNVGSFKNEKAGMRQVNGSKRNKRSSSMTGIETSITSLHSSGRDSGIVDSAPDGVNRCQCGQHSMPSSTESSNSYEDSLKSSVPQKTLPKDSMDRQAAINRSHLNQHRRNLSYSDQFMVHPGPAPLLRGSNKFSNRASSNSRLDAMRSGAGRRSINERVLVTCPSNGRS